MPVAKILMSSCLIGQPVRYDGAARTLRHEMINQWRSEGRVVSICPEITAGFGVPRLPAEISNRGSGQDVLAGKAQVIAATNDDLTDAFLEGARKTLAFAKAEGCQFALLVGGSPSCGSSFIYDGSFTGARHSGVGVTTALLRANGVAVFSEAQIDALAEAIENQGHGWTQPSDFDPL